MKFSILLGIVGTFSGRLHAKMELTPVFYENSLIETIKNGRKSKPSGKIISTTILPVIFRCSGKNGVVSGGVRIVSVKSGIRAVLPTVTELRNLKMI